MRKHLSWRLRGLVMAQSYLPADGVFVCNWCCGRLSLDQVVIDHFVPIAAGGSNEPDNLVVSCARCNLWKSASSPDVAELRINARLEREASA